MQRKASARCDAIESVQQYPVACVYFTIMPGLNSTIFVFAAAIPAAGLGAATNAGSNDRRNANAFIEERFDRPERAPTAIP